MCETVDPSGVDAEIASKILSTVIDGMQAERPNEVRLAATSALINSIDFAEENFNRETERNVIMQTICAATQCPEKQVRERAYECAARVVELYYPLLRPYVDTLFQLTTAAIKTDDPTVGMMAVEFWSTVCDREIEALADVADGVEVSDRYQRLGDSCVDWCMCVGATA
jgi:importin subunit beta-1